jgi:hypothetical protein
MKHMMKTRIETVRSLCLGFPVFYLCLMLTAFGARAETPAEKARIDFQKVNNLYASTASYSFDIQYTVFDSHAGGNLVEQKSGKYMKHQDMSYSKLLDIETIVNPKRTVIVNHEDKFIVITDTRKIELSPLQTDMETLLKQCSNINVRDVGSTERHYTLSFSDTEDESEFSKIEVVINLLNYSIKKMNLYYNQEMPLTENDYYAKEKKPLLEIVYKAFTPLSSVNTALFAETAYVSESNAIYKGKGKCATYEVINQLQSVRFKKK